MNEETALVGEGDRSLFERTVDRIERVGNKVPHPVIIFLALCVTIIVLSQVLAWFNLSAPRRR